MEGLAGSLPGGGLHSQETSYCQSNRHSEKVGMSCGSDDWAHQGVCKSPSDDNMDNELSTELLQLPEVKFLHLEYLPLSQIIILIIYIIVKCMITSKYVSQSQYWAVEMAQYLSCFQYLLQNTLGLSFFSMAIITADLLS